MEAQQPKIQLENLVKIFGTKPRRALQMFRDGADRSTILEATGNVLGVADVSLQINEGELFVIMGLSGSGKSTLIRCINRLIEPTSGRIYIDGQDITDISDQRLREVRRKKAAMVFQRFALLPHRTVAENVEYGLKIQGIAPEQRRTKALEVLEVVGLAQWADYLPSSLSGGMQQRVGLARALATDADVLLMDEAFSALDPLIRREMQDELMRLQHELHKTIVFISHDIQEALKIGDRVAVLRDGKLVQVATPEAMVTSPADDYIAAFTQDVNRAQVLKTGSILRRTVPFILGKGSVENALEHLKVHQQAQMYIVDRHNHPVGFVDQSLLQEALNQGKQDMSAVMRTDFPKAETSNSLEDIFHLCEAGVPVAITSDGKFNGVVEQSDVFASIGRLTETPEASPVVEREPQQVA